MKKGAYTKLVERKNEDEKRANWKEYKIARKKAKLVVTVAKTVVFESLYTGLEEKEGEKRLFRLAKDRERKGHDLDQVEEVRDAVHRMRRGRTTGPDEISVDFWKFSGEASLRWLTYLFNNIFRSAKIPEAWR
ncbi:uncharacterized protein LOC124899541 [Capsicum annuum]|uniref:uncharacterized protein LOC124899541 n=1 Tax=Capsicum annuum TaxID=4072 RepID=UPI001FB103A1|nr:uncharacterized protein LOC124899541 [Capsicum annuum]